MKIFLKNIFLVIFITIIFSSQAKSIDDPNVLIEKIKKEYAKIHDFKAKVGIEVNVTSVNIPNNVGTVYFKEPNKTKYDIQGFSMLPKQGTGLFFLENLNKDKNTFVLSGQIILNGENLKIIKIIPNETNSDLVLTTLYINEATNQIRKVESTTKQSGTFIILIEYAIIENKYTAIAKVEVNFELPTFNLPKTMTGDFNQKPIEKNKDGKTKGKVILKYWDYEINKGISDDIFIDKKKK